MSPRHSTNPAKFNVWQGFLLACIKINILFFRHIIEYYCIFLIITVTKKSHMATVGFLHNNPAKLTEGKFPVVIIVRNRGTHSLFLITTAK